MQVSYKWLQQYVDIPWGPEELAERLTMGGIEVEQVVNRAEGLAGVVSGRIVRLEPHPNANKLQICRMDVGRPELVTIVTGADNVFEGAIVPAALAGAELPTGQKIDLADFRGVASAGMLCSADELGIDKKMAYEVAALANQKVRWPRLAQLVSNTTHPEVVVDVEALDLCPGYLGLVVNNVSVGPSPLWLQNALQAAGLRPINNLVDITNYVLLELGQPLHAFDLDKLAAKQISVRRARRNEEIITLDGTSRRLDDADLVIADADSAVAIAGIMGSQLAEVSGDTQRVFLESAYFDYKSVRRSSRRLGLHTDASSRFDKGVDPARVLMALQRAAQLLQELGCGQPETAAVGLPHGMPAEQQISFRPEQVKRLLGVTICPAEMRSLLERLGLTVDDGQTPWQVVAPSRRRDLQEEVDLIEEIARLYGYAKIPVGTMCGPVMRGRLTERQQAEQNVRHQLLGLGLTEVLTLSFNDPQEVAKVVGPEHPWNQGLLLRNPLSSDRSLMRPTLLFGLLNVLAYNAARQQHDLAIFEVANVFKPCPGALHEQPDEPLHLGVACMGQKPNSWQLRAADYDFFYLKGLLEALLSKQGLTALTWQQASETFLHPGRSAAIYWNGDCLGYLGELHPDVAEQYGLRQRAIVAELALAPVLAQAGRVPLYQGIPRYPAMTRDLAVVVDQSIPAAEVTNIIRQAAGELMVDLQLFDVYQGQQVAGQKKSLAYSLVLQNMERTLLDEEIASLHQRIVGELKSRLGAELR
jgi:phenylalanyl-tRNA synthetase beta chain